MKKLRNFSIAELEQWQVNKQELSKLMGLEENGSFDYSLPQDWLNRQTEKTGLSYDLIRSTTFWVYDNNSIGQPISGCTEIQDTIN